MAAVATERIIGASATANGGSSRDFLVTIRQSMNNLFGCVMFPI